MSCLVDCDCCHIGCGYIVVPVAWKTVIVVMQVVVILLYRLLGRLIVVIQVVVILLFWLLGRL